MSAAGVSSWLLTTRSLNTFPQPQPGTVQPVPMQPAPPRPAPPRPARTWRGGPRARRRARSPQRRMGAVRPPRPRRLHLLDEHLRGPHVCASRDPGGWCVALELRHDDRRDSVATAHRMQRPAAGGLRRVLTPRTLATTPLSLGWYLQLPPMHLSSPPAPGSLPSQTLSAPQPHRRRPLLGPGFLIFPWAPQRTVSPLSPLLLI